MDCCLWARACQCSATISTIKSVSTPSQFFFFVRASTYVASCYCVIFFQPRCHKWPGMCSWQTNRECICFQHFAREPASSNTRGCHHRRHLYFHWALFIDGCCILMLLLLNRFPLFPSLGPVHTYYLPHYCEKGLWDCANVRMNEHIRPGN